MIIKLWRDPEIESTLTVYPRPDGLIRPAMLVIPGGGYGSVCEETEGVPIARRFEELGFQTFVLHYRVAPHRYPAPQLDAFRAIRLIRANAARWGANPHNLAVCGFSAGGHLTACCGTLYNDLDAVDGDEADRESQRPDGLLLCYPVISFTESSHLGSGKNLLGDRFDELKTALSLETRVTADTPPAFLWHTVTDQIVPYENSQCFVRALRNAGRPSEFHLYPSGPHGMQLGYGRSDIAAWPEQAKEFLRLSAHFRYAEPPAKRRTVILTFDDAVKNHRTLVAPLLKEYGFGATFYPCRFNDDWRAQHEEHLLTGAELREIHDLGFEIGNHTWSHPDLRKLSPEEAAAEIDRCSDFLAEAGIPAPVSFAYPGGPFAENAVPLLKERKLRFARTTERLPWEKSADPHRLPAYPISGNDRLGFYHAVSRCTEENAVILVFHGIPDVVHPWCDNTPECFQEFLDYLADGGFQVLSLADFGGASPT